MDGSLMGNQDWLITCQYGHKQAICEFHFQHKQVRWRKVPENTEKLWPPSRPSKNNRLGNTSRGSTQFQSMCRHVQ